VSFEDVHHEHNFDPVALEDAMKELFVGAKCTKLTTIISLVNLCTIHGMNNKFASELFGFLQHHLLHELNCLPTNYYATKALTQKLGLDYENIHACPKGCVLFQGEHRNDVTCPKCGCACYKDVINKVSLVKVLQHFTIILRLQRLFRTPTMFELMLW
jgi:hypothetical protein